MTLSRVLLYVRVQKISNKLINLLRRYRETTGAQLYVLTSVLRGHVIAIAWPRNSFCYKSIFYVPFMPPLDSVIGLSIHRII